MILGAGWQYLAYHPTKRINVVGYHEASTVRKGCRVGTACAVFTDVNGKEFLAIAHQAVENQGSTTSLLSVCQMRSNHVIVDDTPACFLGVDGLPGTHSIRTPIRNPQGELTEDAFAVFNLTMRSALMTCQHRMATDEDIRLLPRVYLTSPDTWQPQSLQDDSDAISPPNTPYLAAYKTETCPSVEILPDETAHPMPAAEHPSDSAKPGPVDGGVLTQRREWRVQAWNPEGLVHMNGGNSTLNHRKRGQ